MVGTVMMWAPVTCSALSAERDCPMLTPVRVMFMAWVNVLPDTSGPMKNWTPARAVVTGNF